MFASLPTFVSIVFLTAVLLHCAADAPEPVAVVEETQPEVIQLEDPQPSIAWQAGYFKGKPFYNQMLDLGLRPDQVHRLIDALTPHYDFRRAHPRHQWRLGHLEEKPHHFELHVSPAEIYDVTGFSEQLTAVQRPIETVTIPTVIRTELNGSLYGSLQDQPNNAELAMKLSNLFAYEIDFFQDPRAGDSFEMLVEQNFIRQDEELVFNRWGNILAARYHGERDLYEGYYYDGLEDGGYFDEDGKSLVRAFLRSPLKLQRITSSFKKRRFHPVLKRYKAHNGVDYGVPKGTPVMAVANGRVTIAGRYGGAGIAVVLRHRNEMDTQYFHLSRIAKGVRKGAKVKQGQIIGYVGKTGLASGYHLHFGMKIRGKYVNPLRQKFQPGPAIPKKHRVAFEEQRREYEALLDRVEESALDPLVYDPGLMETYKPKKSPRL